LKKKLRQQDDTDSEDELAFLDPVDASFTNFKYRRSDQDRDDNGGRGSGTGGGLGLTV
jgi:hypothetical protein